MFKLPSPLHKIEHSLLRDHSVRILVKRDDLIDPEISGNKWRKLKYNLAAAKALNKQSILTFGGAFSNHVAATAAACKRLGWPAVGIIRGEELTADSNPTLRRASELGMALEFVSRQEYRELKSVTPEKRFAGTYVIPEGGANLPGIQGAADIIREIEVPFDRIICPLGTGTTFAGLVTGLHGKSEVLGFSVLKGNFMHAEVRKLMKMTGSEDKNYTINEDYHFGGYGKCTNELVDFINEMRGQTGILLDPIYTGKAFFGVWKMILNGIFDGQTLIFLHTGGLQGIAGFNQKSPRKIHI